MDASSAFEKSIAFLESIGISVSFKPIATECFLPGIAIEDGYVTIDKDKIKYPGDILHEAGHIAVVPANERNSLDEKSIALRENREAEEMMAIAWSYAVCVHLDIDASFVFHKDGYNGGGQSIADNFNAGNYFGVPMLQYVGMTTEKKNAEATGKEPYPAMIQWMRS
ncbi:MAG: hypothetical protein ABJA78_07050 [Ferruginibacter sp.]